MSMWLANMQSICGDFVGKTLGDGVVSFSMVRVVRWSMEHFFPNDWKMSFNWIFKGFKFLY